jgi:hypothetical protein
MCGRRLAAFHLLLVVRLRSSCSHSRWELFQTSSGLLPPSKQPVCSCCIENRSHDAARMLTLVGPREPAGEEVVGRSLRRRLARGRSGLDPTRRPRDRFSVVVPHSGMAHSVAGSAGVLRPFRKQQYVVNGPGAVQSSFVWVHKGLPTVMPLGRRAGRHSGRRPTACCSAERFDVVGRPPTRPPSWRPSSPGTVP